MIIIFVTKMGMADEEELLDSCNIIRMEIWGYKSEYICSFSHLFGKGKLSF